MIRYNFLNMVLIAIISTIMFCCKKESKIDYLNDVIKNQVNENINTVIIFSEFDCNPCLYDYANQIIIDNNTVVLYYSKHASEFLKKLKKINPNIKWKLTNKKIIDLIYAIKGEYKGPYFLKKINDKFDFINSDKLLFY